MHVLKLIMLWRKYIEAEYLHFQYLPLLYFCDDVGKDNIEINEVTTK